MTLQEFTSSHGLPENLPLDGAIHRFNLHGRNDGWWVGKQLPSGIFINAGSWKTGDEFSFVNGTGQGDFQREIQEMRAQNDKEKHEANLNAAIKCRKILKELKEINDFSHPYLVRKGFGKMSKPPELKHIYSQGEDLIVSMYNADHAFAICGFQRITPDVGKIGNKFFQRGAQTSGSYLTLPGPEGAKVIFAEGLSTALSIWLALNQACHVIVCFNAGNLLKVGLSLREKIKSKMFIAADDDWLNKKNAGMIAAKLAAEELGAGILIPPFKRNNPGEDEFSDWNDYHNYYGFGECTLELVHQIEYGASRKQITELACNIKPTTTISTDPIGEFIDSMKEHLLVNLIKSEKIPASPKTIADDPLMDDLYKEAENTRMLMSGDFYEKPPQTISDDPLMADVVEPSMGEIARDGYKQVVNDVEVITESGRTHTTPNGITINLKDNVYMDDGSCLAFKETGIYSTLKSIKIEPPKWMPAAKGKKVPTPPTQNSVASALADAYKPYLMREKKDVFAWLGTHWEELNADDLKSFIRNQSQSLMFGRASDKDLNAYYNIFRDKLPKVSDGQSFYMQLKNISNFRDGTLWLLGRGKESYLEFRPHVQSDLITWVLPYEYKAPRPVNEKFNAWLDRTFYGNEDAAGKIKAMRMLGGACLIPMFSCLGFFYGPAGTGKSTFAKLCMAFMGRGNFSTLPPEEMHGFQLETMINKRVNIVTDIAGGRVDKGIFKRFADKMEMHVNRKNKTAVDARLPLLHIFCGNELPVGMDCISTAMDRRIAIVEVNNQLAIADMQEDLELTILDHGAGAILDFFEQGLRDLCANGGRYFNPESGKAIFEEYKNEHPTRAFIEAIKKGEIKIDGDEVFLDENSKIYQPDLAKSFFEFSHQTGGKWTPTRHKFYRELRQLGYINIASHGKDYFKGIGRRIGVLNHGTQF